MEAVEMIEPPPTLRISWIECLIPKKYTAQQNCVRSIPILGGDVLEWAKRANKACVIEGDVKATELSYRTSDHRLDVGFRRDIRPLEDGASAVFAA